MRTLGEIGKDTAEGATRGGLWGALIGGGAVLLAAGATIATGGAALPVLAAALPVAGGTAVTGAGWGAGIGGVMGATGFKEEIDKVAGVVALGALSGGSGSPSETPKA
ncbi:MAG: hypothetical protein IJQ58_07040 [Synergistaceae bacterium]|nr:hypothetical protein [Synergistaceae bacterium]